MHEPLEEQKEEKTIYEGFLISVLLKGIISINEVISGIIILFIPPMLFLAFTDWVAHFIPTSGFIGSHLSAELQSYTARTSRFLAFYFLSRGSVKVFLIWAMLKKILWAYPAAIAVMGAFVLYQLYQIATTHSILVIGITVFDLVVMYFIWREYKVVLAHRAEAN